MARLPVNPTRMELARLKTRHKTAVRGHKLLKDKLDEMVRQFLQFAKKNKKLRAEVEAALNAALSSFLLATALANAQTIENTLLLGGKKVKIHTDIRSLMGVDVPTLNLEESDNSDLYNYSFISTPSQVDVSFGDLSDVLPQMIELAEVEKACTLLADEIEKNRRRINALEHMIIPQMEETISYIIMKLDESERSALVRLMKVKEMINEYE